jgi:hypothetical protein
MFNARGSMKKNILGTCIVVSTLLYSTLQFGSDIRKLIKSAQSAEKVVEDSFDEIGVPFWSAKVLSSKEIKLLEKKKHEQKALSLLVQEDLDKDVMNVMHTLKQGYFPQARLDRSARYSFYVSSQDNATHVDKLEAIENNEN